QGGRTQTGRDGAEGAEPQQRHQGPDQAAGRSRGRDQRGQRGQRGPAQRGDGRDRLGGGQFHGDGGEVARQFHPGSRPDLRGGGEQGDRAERGERERGQVLPAAERVGRGCCGSHSSRSASKQVRSPVWQAPPVWSTLTSRVSPSQSSATETTRWVFPEVAPFTQYSPRLRDQ